MFLYVMVFNVVDVLGNEIYVVVFKVVYWFELV